MSALPEWEKSIRQALRDDFSGYALKCLKIRPKSGRLTAFDLNPVQQFIHAAAERQLRENGKVRLLVLKARQPGVSTYVEGRFYLKADGFKSVSEAVGADHR